MMFCQDHWDRLRAKIAERGLNSLIALDAEIAVQQLRDRVEKEETTVVNFDPLMYAHWAILSNATETIGKVVGSGAVLYLLSDAPEDPIVFGRYPNGKQVKRRLSAQRVSQSWPRCPLCYMGVHHELTCAESRCNLELVDGFAWYLDKAADEAKEKAKELGVMI